MEIKGGCDANGCTDTQNSQKEKLSVKSSDPIR